MSRRKGSQPVRVGLITLGCAKNLVDAEIILGHLVRDGLQITNDPVHADVVIVNTCSFIDDAQEESVDTILQSAQLREVHHPGQGLVVSGCLPQRYREQLPQLMPEVDVFMGVDQVADAPRLVRQALVNRQQRLATAADAIASVRKRARRRPRAGTGTQAASSAPSAPAVEVHRRPHYIPDVATPRFRLTPGHLAYVKIAEGCNHPCSFCIIPRMRGRHRSRPLADILEEARHWVAGGVKELNLISQDSTYYGLDLQPNPRSNLAVPDRFRAAARRGAEDAPTLPRLLRELNAMPGDFWIRLLYTHPAHWTPELIRTMAACPKVARYADIPLQHIHPNMLERMRRETSREYIVDLLRQIRGGLPDIALRTTFIVGFPGETAAAFESLLAFIRETRFERLGVFTYSREDGTLAGRMARQVPDRVKQERRDRAMALQRGLARALGRSWVGRSMRVLVEREARATELGQTEVRSWEHGFVRQTGGSVRRWRGRYMVARGQADAPDIDGRIYVRGQLPAGQFARVTIIGHTDYDLIAEP